MDRTLLPAEDGDGIEPLLPAEECRQGRTAAVAGGGCRGEVERLLPLHSARTGFVVRLRAETPNRNTSRGRGGSASGFAFSIP